MHYRIHSKMRPDGVPVFRAWSANEDRYLTGEMNVHELYLFMARNAVHGAMVVATHAHHAQVWKDVAMEMPEQMEGEGGWCREAAQHENDQAKRLEEYQFSSAHQLGGQVDTTVSTRLEDCQVTITTTFRPIKE